VQIPFSNQNYAQTGSKIDPKLTQNGYLGPTSIITTDWIMNYSKIVSGFGGFEPFLYSKCKSKDWHDLVSYEGSGFKIKYHLHVILILKLFMIDTSTNSNFDNLIILALTQNVWDNTLVPSTKFRGVTKFTC
jgi:hypothetical protein